MRYLPKSDEERRQMLAEIGAASIDDLFAIIPAEYRLDRDLDCAAPAGGERDRRLLPRRRRRRTPPITRAFWARAPIAITGR